MTLPLSLGPPEVAPPYFDWDADDNVDLGLDPVDGCEEVDLTDLLEPPPDPAKTD